MDPMEVPYMATEANSTGSLLLALYTLPWMTPCCAKRAAENTIWIITRVTVFNRFIAIGIFGVITTKNYLRMFNKNPKKLNKNDI
jgi:hypothetical protein